MTNALPRELASVVVVGAANVDTTYFVDGMPLAGETVLASRTMSGPGGKGANQAAGLAALGVPVELVCAVGGDEQGKFLALVLEKRGGLMQVKGTP
jgi:ribokinase